jgi:hypothetical protein
MHPIAKLFDHMWLVGDLAKRFSLQGETLLSMPPDVLRGLVIMESEQSNVSKDNDNRRR